MRAEEGRSGRDGHAVIDKPNLRPAADYLAFAIAALAARPECTPKDMADVIESTLNLIWESGARVSAPEVKP